MTDRFDVAAITWDQKPGRMEMAEKFSNEVRKALRGKSARVAMEYGCGTANVSFFLKDFFPEIILADASKGMLEEVKKKIKASSLSHFTPCWLDVEKKDFSRKTDAIYMLMSLHHVGNVEKVLQKLAKSLNPGGVIIIGDLVKEDGNFHQFPENQEVHHGFEREELEKIFKDSGLKVYSYHLFHEIEKEHTGASVIYPLFVMAAERG